VPQEASAGGTIEGPTQPDLAARVMQGRGKGPAKVKVGGMPGAGSAHARVRQRDTVEAVFQACPVQGPGLGLSWQGQGQGIAACLQGRSLGTPQAAACSRPAVACLWR